MSLNNTILILRLRYGKRFIWLVTNVEGHECFANTQWTRWWIYNNCPQQYTTNKKLAYHIAHKMNEIHQTEYGVIQFNSRVNIEDFKLKGGKLNKCDSGVIAPANNYADLETVESDWLIVDKMID